MKKHNYAEVIYDATFRLSCDADNRRAGQLLKETYSQALVYYQGELDRILTSNDQFKWMKTLELMQKTNELSEEILYNSAASQLICEPKIYTSEITDVKQKASAELYDAGINSLNQNTKQKAKEAYFYLIEADKLNPDYKDVAKKILEAKERATFKVIIDSVPAHTQHNILSFSTTIFYEKMFYELRQKFPYRGFVYFYTPEEAQKQKIKNPDQIVQIEISNFEIMPYRLLATKFTIIEPSKKLELVDGKYVWKNVEKDYIPGPGQQVHEHEYTRLDMKSYVALNIKSLFESKVIYKYRMPWNYSEELGYSYSSGISQRHISYSPDNQIFFDHFSLSLCDQVVDRLSLYFREYN